MTRIDPFDLAAWAAELERHGADTAPFLSAYAAALQAVQQRQLHCAIEQVPRIAASLQQVARELDERRAMLDRMERRITNGGSHDPSGPLR